MTRYKGTGNDRDTGRTPIEKVLSHTRRDGGHLLWEGKFDHNGAPYFSLVENLKKTNILVRHWLYVRTWPEQAAGARVRNECGVENCVLPNHQINLNVPAKGKPGPRRIRRIRKSRVDLIHNLAEHGYTAEEISIGLNLNHATVARILNSASST